MVAGVT